ncbi:MAG: DNA polymerase III subunit epsilon [Gammaproteobacteria bacterium]|nr:DNA polymerase III subunit epsilon [Gammaproteobacteria bacterium]
MRQIVLDTETTGLAPEQGHRIVEIGCIELVNRRRSELSFHRYLNPGRSIDSGALEVHGLGEEFLRDKPAFAEIVDEFLEFVRGAEVIIHNAPFDVAFIDAELRRLGPERGCFADLCTVTDTLELARQLHPGQRNSLDALCKRYEVDNSARTLHGALLDAEILGDVYLAMTGGQAAFALEDDALSAGAGSGQARVPCARAPLRVIRPTAEEVAAHASRLEAIARVSGDRCMWGTDPDAAG